MNNILNYWFSKLSAQYIVTESEQIKIIPEDLENIVHNNLTKSLMVEVMKKITLSKSYDPNVGTVTFKADVYVVTKQELLGALESAYNKGFRDAENCS